MQDVTVDCVVTMALSSEDIKDMMAVTGRAEQLSCFGYLTTYGVVGGYETVNVYRDGREQDLVAVYKRGEHRFVMGAVWRPELQAYSFHS